MGICLPISHPLPWTLQWEASLGSQESSSACLFQLYQCTWDKPAQPSALCLGWKSLKHLKSTFISIQVIFKGSNLWTKISLYYLVFVLDHRRWRVTKNLIFVLYFSTWCWEYNAFCLWDDRQVAQAARACPLGGASKAIRQEWGQLWSLCRNFWFSVRQSNWLCDSMSYSLSTFTTKSLDVCKYLSSFQANLSCMIDTTCLCPILHLTVACQPSVHPHRAQKPKQFTAAAIGERHVRAERGLQGWNADGTHTAPAYSQGFLKDFTSPALFLFLFLL